ncbi:LysE family translocator [Rhodoligotrophos ferricapiens]|uniref:LysE family translocator n=1 Tax=Rhodoligotrophos ferricapiens TaxID=3069264 RepID=UPI00315D1E81
MSDIWMFLGALAIAYLVPGQDMILMLQAGSLRGRGYVLATAFGLAMARAAHVSFAAIGLAALLKTFPIAFELVRLAGATYLVWLGIGLIRSEILTSHPEHQKQDIRPFTRVTAISRGLLTNLTNPKALLFCSVLLPQFVQPDLGNAAVQFALLGLILVGMGVIFDIILGFAGSGMARILTRYPLVRRVQQFTFGVLLIGFGARLAMLQRAE